MCTFSPKISLYTFSSHVEFCLISANADTIGDTLITAAPEQLMHLASTGACVHTTYT